MAKKKPTPAFFRSKGFQGSVVTGLMIASILGWDKWNKLGPNIFNNKTLFPYTGVVKMVEDGDTFELNNQVIVRLVGVNAPDRGEDGYDQSANELKELIEGKRVWLEYDRYLMDKNGGDLAWIWIECEKPTFTKYNYMHLSGNKSRPGLMDNPEGCKKGKLVQEELVKSGNAKVETYKDRGELKYEERIRTLLY